ncbi:hypothetical protein N867_15220 [Actinotalea fermentans ATCC 43279 = JCM 9966 = DSM 3133]|nr:hypothetical protein N867_15220 [Actinotalea fermentans ATCC 43279 = JCM 9966 = DSM 3133]
MAMVRAREAVPVAPVGGRLAPIGVGAVEITGGFWAERRAVNSASTLEHCTSWLEELGWLANFDRAAAGQRSERSGREFADSETYKVIEACAWDVAGAADPQARETAERLYQSLAARVVAAQQPDGYLNTRFGGAGQPERYSDLAWGHELYCAGHLIQAAVARLRTAGEDAFVRAAYRVADHVCSVFGPGGAEQVCGHPEIETALAELARATGVDRYRQTAAAFVERRGRGLLPPSLFGSAYFQDDVPVREATVLRGHAVRALYLSAAAVDVAVDTGDDDLLAAVVRQWDATLARRTYLTGGMGSRLMDESFGDDYELPSDGAYAETCAGIASIMLAWRLLLATGEERFADAMERAMYNIVAASVGRDGRSFFYANTLHRRVAVDDVDPSTPHPRSVSGLRAPWFDVSCCPTNSARFLASLPGYVATADGDGVQIHQYATSRVRTVVRGMNVDLDVETDYPVSGRVAVTIRTDAAEPWSLSLRVPEWADGGARLDGVPVVGPVARVTRAFSSGDTVVLDLPVVPRLVHPDHRIDAVRGTVAAMRGPLVECLESIDLPPGARLEDVVVLPEPPRLEAGRVVLRGVTVEASQQLPYRREPDRSSRSSEPFDVVLVPYLEHAERGPSAMRVWLPLATPDPEATA